MKKRLMSVDPLEIASCDPKSSDQGYTHLLGGIERKDSLIAEAIGDVDETNALIGICRESSIHVGTKKNLSSIIGDLFVIGAELARTNVSDASHPRISFQRIAALDLIKENLEKDLIEINHFVRPVGRINALVFNHARTVCRRAERHVVAIHLRREKHGPLNMLILAYLNRLGSVLYLMFRMELAAGGEKEWYWSRNDSL